MSISDFAWSETRYPDYAFVVLHYTLTSGASDVEVCCYKPDLAETAIDDPETFRCTAGTHNVLVEFAVDREVMGPYRFVISAEECAADAALNRAKDTKHALQMGATQMIWPPATGFLGAGIPENPHTLAQVVAEMGATGIDDTCYTATGDSSHTAYPAREGLHWSAVAMLFAHASPGGWSFDDQTFETHDLLAGTGTDCSESDVWYVSNIPDSLDHVLFTLAMGCCTAGTGQWSQSSVAQSILDKGGHSVIGFVDITSSDCEWTFAHQFFYETEFHCTVDLAAGLAKNEVFRVHQEYGGTDSWVRGGANVDLRPARFGAASSP